ncbi:MAG TPA: hypothetical protein PLG99_01800 [Kaistiaceae bacterium]|nr:hypothetical protein [Kaistiaceae bacterium]
MKRHLTTFLAMLAVVGAVDFATPVFAGEQPNLLIMGEDADQDTVPRNSRVFNQVLNALAGEMQAKGFKVYDETAVSMDITNPGVVRRTDAEVLTIAKRIPGVPIDVATVFQIYAFAERNPYANITDLRVRIPGRLINVQTGQALGNYEIAYGPGQLTPLPVQCNRDCVLEHVGGEAKKIATDVGAVLAQKLDFLSPARPQSPTAVLQGGGMSGMTGVPSGMMGMTGMAAPSDCTGMTTAYSLVFNGFAPEEITRIEEYIVSFKGYDHHRPMRAQLTSSEYWYETCSDAARLNRNLRLMAEQMGIQTRIGMVGNKIQVDKIAPPMQR